MTASDPIPTITLPLWDGPAPGEPAVPAKPEQMITGEDRVTRANDVSVPTLAVYPPPSGTGSGSAVVVCPGGGYNILAWDKEGTEVVRWLNGCGITGVLLKYRCPVRHGRPRHEAGVQDLQRAISLVRSRAVEWGIRPDRIGALGFSAGGHAVACASAGVLPRLYAPVDHHDLAAYRPDFSVLVYPAYLVGADPRTLQPDVAPTATVPPAFLVHAHDDGHSSEGSIAYYLAMKRLGIAAELHVYASGGHGFGMRPSAHPAHTWPERCREWLASRGLLTAV
jgi:acetyl esterase/lipase